MSDSVKSAAQSAENSTTFRRVARGGYVASGVVHAIIGVMSISIAFTGRGESDQSSALETLTSAPLGVVAVWVLALLLLTLGLFHVTDGIAQYSGDRKKKWGRRVSELGQGAVFIAMGVLAVSVALGNSSDGDQSAEQASRGLLDVPGGPVLLAIAGIALSVGGVVFMVMGVLRSFRKKMRLPSGALGRWVSALGLVGFIAKGAAIAVIGTLVLLAAVRNDPDSAGALDTAVQTLRDLPGGVAIVAAIGVGFLAYAAFCGFRARYARL